MLCFTVHENTIYCVQGPTMYRCSNPAAAEPTFTAMPVGELPGLVTSIDRIGDRFYLGMINGEIWVASADGSDVVVTPPTVEDQIHDQFGRGLAFFGEKLLVGAPNAAAPVSMAGGTEIWRHREGAWEREVESIAPVPDFSGWYGRDVALHHELGAVVEAGHDLSGKARGADAKVHVQQFRDGAWIHHSTLSVPFAQSVAFQQDLLCVPGSHAPPALPCPDLVDGVPGYRAPIHLARCPGQIDPTPVSTPQQFAILAYLRLPSLSPSIPFPGWDSPVPVRGPGGRWLVRSASVGSSGGRAKPASASSIAANMPRRAVERQGSITASPSVPGTVDHPQAAQLPGPLRELRDFKQS